MTLVFPPYMMPTMPRQTKAEKDVIRSEAVERLRRELKRWGWTVSAWSKRIEFDRSKVYDWLEGRGLPQKPEDADNLRNAIAACALTLNLTPDEEVGRSVMRVIPVLPGLSAGRPTRAFGEASEIEVMDWGTEGERYGRYIEGDSMYPEIKHGDLVIFEVRSAEPNHVVHAMQDEFEDTVKIFRPKGNKCALVPLNDAFPTIQMDSTWIVRGVAMQIIRKVSPDEEVIRNFPNGMRCR